MYNSEKVNIIKKVFSNNGIDIIDGMEETSIVLDSLGFLSLLIDLENTLGVDLVDDEELFELDYRSFTFNKFLDCLKIYLD
ncbi:hypothetical protein [Streptococcus equinus]|uniref:hypothetical protein n=1 Tax=Streptococcus equinus TaxID=1335 RepID=UPI0015F76104|nr:hypothetical protein [Streptococcus equinus]QMS96656.1 hypothetical protein H1R75_01835 [Streptococcus equinus]